MSALACDDTCPVTCDDSSSGGSGVDWGSDSDTDIARQTWATQNMVSDRASKPLFQKYRKGIPMFASSPVRIVSVWGRLLANLSRIISCTVGVVCLMSWDVCSARGLAPIAEGGC